MDGDTRKTGFFHQSVTCNGRFLEVKKETGLAKKRRPAERASKMISQTVGKIFEIRYLGKVRLVFFQCSLRTAINGH